MNIKSLKFNSNISRLYVISKSPNLPHFCVILGPPMTILEISLACRQIKPGYQDLGFPMAHQKSPLPTCPALMRAPASVTTATVLYQRVRSRLVRPYWQLIETQQQISTPLLLIMRSLERWQARYLDPRLAPSLAKKTIHCRQGLHQLVQHLQSSEM